MDKISQSISLKGKIETITLTELRKQPGEVFMQVELGKKFIITKKEMRIAMIVPMREAMTLPQIRNKGAAYA